MMLPIATSLLSSFSQGGLFGDSGGGGEMPDMAKSGISGATSFSTGDFNVVKSDTTTLVIVVSVALLAFAYLRKRK